MPYPNIVPIEFFTSSHSQLGCNKFSSWVTPHSGIGQVVEDLLKTKIPQEKVS